MRVRTLSLVFSHSLCVYMYSSYCHVYDTISQKSYYKLKGSVVLRKRGKKTIDTMSQVQRLLVLVAMMMVVVTKVASHDYGDALSKSILFFEGQRSGKLPPNQRMTWRKDSALRDGFDIGVSLFYLFLGIVMIRLELIVLALLRLLFDYCTYHLLNMLSNFYMVMTYKQSKGVLFYEKDFGTVLKYCYLSFPFKIQSCDFFLMK